MSCNLKEERDREREKENPWLLLCWNRSITPTTGNNTGLVLNSQPAQLTQQPAKLEQPVAVEAVS